MSHRAEIDGIIEMISRVYNDLTPGAIERADLDGMAFDLDEARTRLAALRPVVPDDLTDENAILVIPRDADGLTMIMFSTQNGDIVPIMLSDEYLDELRKALRC